MICMPMPHFPLNKTAHAKRVQRLTAHPDKGFKPISAISILFQMLLAFLCIRPLKFYDARLRDHLLFLSFVFLK